MARLRRARDEPRDAEVAAERRKREDELCEAKRQARVTVTRAETASVHWERKSMHKRARAAKGASRTSERPAAGWEANSPQAAVRPIGRGFASSRAGCLIKAAQAAYPGAPPPPPSHHAATALTGCTDPRTRRENDEVAVRATHGYNKHAATERGTKTTYGTDGDTQAESSGSLRQAARGSLHGGRNGEPPPTRRPVRRREQASSPLPVPPRRAGDPTSS